MADFDGIVIGAGHNGLTAAIVLARAGWKMAVVEKANAPGGAAKTQELTLPGFRHDTYAANIGLFLGSAIFREMKEQITGSGFGISAGPQPYANVFPDGDSICGYMDPQKMVDEISRHSSADGEAWTQLLHEFGKYSGYLLPFLQMPLPSLKAAVHAWKAYRKLGSSDFLDLVQLLLKSPREFVDSRFQSEKVKALFVPWGFHLDFGPDISGGAMFPYLEVPLDYMNGLCFSTGGVGNLISALVKTLNAHGGELMLGNGAAKVLIEHGRAVGVRLNDGSQMGAGKAVIANVTPPRLFGPLVDEGHLPASFMRKVRRFRYGAATMMIHLAMEGPVPWLAGEHLSRCSYVHIGPYMEDISRAYLESSQGYLPVSPMLIVGQQSRIDKTRAPQGKETLWIQVRAVPSVPRGDGANKLSDKDWETLKEPYGERVLNKIEAYAPGFKDKILGMKIISPLDMEKDNPNLVGGDSISGSQHLDQNFLFMPFPGWSRYRTPVKGLYMVGQSTWPGAGLNATSGYLCAQELLTKRRLLPW